MNITQDEIIEMAIKGHAGTRDAIRWAIEQALAAPVQTNIKTYLEKDNSQFKFSDYESDGMHHNKPAVPDAMTSADIQEHIEYVAGWNDCRAEMLKGMKP
jgi:hypothetical protein